MSTNVTFGIVGRLVVAPSAVTCASEGPTWLMKSFRRELDLMIKPQVVQSYLTKIGKVYFNIQPPPSMMSMMENMLGGGGMGGINPAMMQAAMAQMQGM